MKYSFSKDSTNLIITLDTESGKYAPEVTSLNDPNITLENGSFWIYENGQFLRFLSFDQISTIDGVIPSNVDDAFTKLNTIINTLHLLASPKFKGTAVPTDTPTGTEDAFWIASQAGTYTNFGGVVVSANSRAEISRVSGVFTISQTPLDITSKVNVSDVINTLTSTETTKPLSAAQGKILNDNKASLVMGKNLFNKATAVIGKFLSPSNGEGINANYDYSDFISVVAGQQYTCSHYMQYITYFDSNKIYVAGGGTFQTNVTIPVGVSFIKITIYHSELNRFQLEKGSVATVYEAYYNAVPLTQIPDLTALFRAKTSIEPLRLNETDWAVLGKNLFNKLTATTNFFVNWTNGNLTASVDYSTSDFIPILPSTQYVSLACQHYAFYTSGKVYISGSNTSAIVVSPSNAAYIRFSIYTSTAYTQNITNAQLEKASVATSYESHGYSVSLLKINGLTSKWEGIETNCLGDSITAQNQWQPFLVSNLGLALTNFGIGGTTLAGTATNSLNNDSRVNALSSTAKLVIILGGTNDWASNYPLGLENSTALTDFYGGLNVLMTKLLTKYNTAGVLTKFLFIGTPYGEMLDFASRGWANAYTNSIGLTTKDYAEAIKKRCLFYGIPYCDTSNLGWNNINIRQYITDDGGLLHPNANGGRRISEVVVGKLKQIEPIV